MRNDEHRVVITGLGLVTPLGNSPESFWSALAENRGAVAPIQAFPVDGIPVTAAGEVSGFEPKSLVLPKHRKTLAKSLKYMARDIQLAVAAADMAILDAGLSEGGVDPARIGIDLGAGLISSELDELAPAINLSYGDGDTFNFETYGRAGIPLITPIWLLKYLPNMLACHISILNDCQGPSNSVTQSEAASLLAIGEAYRIIARGRADVMVTGGADSKIHPMSLIRMNLFGLTSRWQGEASGACRPFDRQRTGWVPGEGASILIIESLDHAQARGARIYGELLGFGSGCDAYPAGGLDPEGAGTEIAIRAALDDAGVEVSQISHINAHGASTPESDLAESRAIHRLCGKQASVPVTALKGFFGNTASACGAVELAGSLLGARKGFVPPTLNCDDPDPECNLDVVHGSPRPAASNTFVKTSLTRHGQAAALVVSAYPEAAS